jgi:hypothetical protein
MKNLLSTLFFLFFATLLFSQKIEKGTLISVLGVNNYVIDAVGQAIEITVYEDPNKCDPRKGNMTLDEQISFLSRELQNFNIDFSKFQLMDNNFVNKFRHKNYKYVTKLPEEIAQISKICTNFGVTVGQIYYEMPPEHLESQDFRAIAALKDAVHKAEVIAKKMGAKKVKILSIDDDTSAVPFEDYEDYEDMDDEKLERITMLLEMLSNYSGSKNQSSSSKESSYSIMVHFVAE